MEVQTRQLCTVARWLEGLPVEAFGVEVAVIAEHVVPRHLPRPQARLKVGAVRVRADMSDQIAEERVGDC